jgi:hypothetical protein
MAMMEGAIIPVSDFPTNNENVEQQSRRSSILYFSIAKRIFGMAYLR